MNLNESSFAGATGKPERGRGGRERPIYLNPPAL